VLRKAIGANKALAELKGAGFDSESGCFDNAIVLQEARLSSGIEKVVTRNDECTRDRRKAYVRFDNDRS
jgi:hypothetical protein